MKLIDIPTPNRFRDIRLSILFKDRKSQFEVGFCKLEYDADDCFSLQQASSLAKVQWMSKETLPDIQYFFQSNNTNLVEITNVEADAFTINIVFFQRGTPPILEKIEVGCDDIFIKGMKRASVFDKRSLKNTLPQELEIQDPYSGETWLLLFAGNDPENFSAAEEDAFSVVGRNIMISLEQRETFEGKMLFATKYHSLQKRMSSIILAKGSISFVPEDQAKLVSKAITNWKKENSEEADFYMDTWDQYGDLEWDAFLQKVYSVGIIKLINVVSNGENLNIRISKEAGKSLSFQDTLQIFDAQFPIDISTKDPIVWSDFRSKLKDYRRENQRGSFTVGKIIFDNETAVVTVSNPDKVFLSTDDKLQYCMDGEITQIKRRHDAREKIKTGQAGIPNLHMILTPGGEQRYQAANRKSKSLEAMSDFVEEKIYGTHPPRPKQIQAIEIALNTPDIAIIQGPPGTGKTTVIAAIVERLNQLEKNRTNIAGTVLVSAYQQDAVDNLVSRLTVNSLPSWKLGGRRKDNELYQYDKLQYWCTQVVEQVNHHNPMLTVSKAQKSLSRLWLSYVNFPCTTFSIRFLEQVLDHKKLFGLSQDMDLRIRNKIIALQKSEQAKRTSFHDIRRHIYSIRTTEQGILDDGQERVKELLQYVEKTPQFQNDFSSWKKELEDFVQNSNTPTKNDRKRLLSIKQALLLQFRAPKQYTQELPDSEILLLKDEIFHGLKTSSNESIEDILVEYIEELETDMYSIIRVLLEYNYVYATSVQQSVNKQVIDTKQAYQKQKEANNLYDTVIIDEAARTAPRDLLIPMVLAKKRIILVGDHRQLPHIVESSLLKQIEEGEESTTKRDILSKSLFEHLFDRCAALERMDGISRRKTLDAQFRMHPLLGNFVSDQFYPPEEHFTSPLPAHNFTHDIPKLGDKCAIWIDIPFSKKFNEQKLGTSRIREIETRFIVAQLAKWLNDDKNKDLSFGVISFYKAQTEQINKALLDPKNNLSDDGNTLREEVRMLGNGHERLRVGTVDAFQGMEFDVVFLSTVRTYNLEKIHEGTQPHYVFGHINSAERLCVSMSRQKKLLITVGDGRLMQSDFAKKYCTKLSNFYSLCQSSEYGLVHDHKKGLL